MAILYVALGGAIGSVLRYLMQGWIGRTAGMNFPYGTLLVNISGSLVMGLFIGWMARTTPENAQNLRLFIAIGILGGYTTFSSFSLDAITLLQEGRWLEMSAYILSSVIFSLLGLFLGLTLVSRFA